jgi:hypothetical protein
MDIYIDDTYSMAPPIGVDDKYSYNDIRGTWMMVRSPPSEY